MPSRGRRPWRPKTISAQGVMGQKGINLIERTVLEMESQWTASGPNEVGIDGYIEFFDPGTRKPLGLTLAVQSKVFSALADHVSPTFSFQCKPADVEYWLSGSMPVILVVSSPATDEAYWVSVKHYFKDWTPTKPTTVIFKRANQKFAASSLKALLGAAAPPDGLYFAATPRPERLHSNLLRVRSFPSHIFVADTDCRSAADVWALLRRHQEVDAGWVARNRRLISFHDLGESPWTAICDTGTVEAFSTCEWSDSTDPDRQRVFVQLLNRTLRAQLSPQVRYWPNQECFAVVGKPGGITKSLRLSYQALKRKSVISAVSRFSRTTPDGRAYETFRHMGFRGQFRRLDENWYLEITPTYRFTKDGFELDRFHDDRLRGIKRMEGNRAVLSSVMFWADYIRRGGGLFETAPQSIEFEELVTFDALLGIDDSQWGQEDPAPGRDAEVQADAVLFLPDFGGGPDS